MDDELDLDDEIVEGACHMMKLYDTYEKKKSQLLKNDPNLENDMVFLKESLNKMMALLNDKQKDFILEKYKTYKLKPLY